MGKYIAYIVLLASIAVGTVWYVRHQRVPPAAGGAAQPAGKEDSSWLADLASPNTRTNDAAKGKVTSLGVRAVPQIQATLRDLSSSRDDRRAALRACAILALEAETAIPDVAAALPDPDLTAEAAIALSFMGARALPPLAAALKSEDAVVRREALRAIGKLRFRAPVESTAVLPLLLDSMIDPDGTVRTVAATYLGIIHEDPRAAVPLLTQGLQDPEPGVRRASAEALGSFGGEAAAALPALRKAAADPDPDLALEAGRAVVAVSGGTK